MPLPTQHRPKRPPLAPFPPSLLGRSVHRPPRRAGHAWKLRFSWQTFLLIKMTIYIEKNQSLGDQCTMSTSYSSYYCKRLQGKSGSRRKTIVAAEKVITSQYIGLCDLSAKNYNQGFDHWLNDEAHLLKSLSRQVRIITDTVGSKDANLTSRLIV